MKSLTETVQVVLYFLKENIDNLFFICPTNEKPVSWWEIGFFVLTPSLESVFG